MEAGGEGLRLYTYRYTVTTRMIPALRWAAMRAILMFQSENDGQSHKTVSTNHNLFQEKGEPKRYRTEVLPLTNLTPYRWAKPGYGSRPLRSITDRLSRTELLELPIGRFSEAGLLEGMRFVIFLT